MAKKIKKNKTYWFVILLNKFTVEVNGYEYYDKQYDVYLFGYKIFTLIVEKLQHGEIDN